MLLALIVSPASAWLPANKSVESIAASGSVVESSEIKLTKLRSGTMTGSSHIQQGIAQGSKKQWHTKVCHCFLYQTMGSHLASACFLVTTTPAAAKANKATPMAAAGTAEGTTLPVVFRTGESENATLPLGSTITTFEPS